MIWIINRDQYVIKSTIILSIYNTKQIESGSNSSIQMHELTFMSKLNQSNKDIMNQLANREEDQIIKKLLKDAKTLQKRNLDPIRSQVYLEWMDFKVPQRRRIKTEYQSNYSSQSRMLHLKGLKTKQLQRKQNAVYESQRKHYSQSVQFPKISKNFHNRQQIQKDKKPQISRYLSVHNSKKVTIDQDLVQISEINAKITKKGVISSKQQLNSNSYKQTKKSNIKFLNNSNVMKYRSKNLQRKGKNNTKMKKKQWQQIDILGLDTYFMKIKKRIRESHNNDGSAECEDILVAQMPMFETETGAQVRVNEQLNVSKNWTFPPKQKVPEYIRRYSVLNQDICVDQLVKKDDFTVVYDNKKEGEQFLYFGSLVDQQKQGLGIYVTKSHKFQGKWRNNQKMEGYQISPKGNYFGKFKKNKRHGQGQFMWNNGQSYTGQWSYGLKNGSGMWKSGKGDSYIGNWTNGKVQGYGVHISYTGQKYEGDFVNFLKSGKGKQKFPNGDIYQGEYRRGKPHGYGKYSWKIGVIFEGEFIDGYRHGRGTICAADYLNFNGDFELDRANGYGQLVYENGNCYKGQFKNGKQQGRGMMSFKEQKKIYDGIWSKGQFKYDNVNKGQ